MNNKIALFYMLRFVVSCALAQDAGLITHGAEVVEVQGDWLFGRSGSTRDGILYFTDIDNNVVHLHPGGRLNVPIRRVSTPMA